ncbi:ribonuclease HII [Bombilactobacillus bombi]|uniref:ribonuclease HII n=1 Tax=Bombilactobacillus bombi TaxID=1303590 RepID=UPI001F07684E|nr:ribonuclease HII [Bombilactobacillus bombi]
MSENISHLTINQIKKLLAQKPTADYIWDQIKDDPRQGVQKLAISHQKKLIQQERLKQSFEQRLQIEKHFWNQGQVVAGIDEVGRGPLAGPVVTAAVVLPANIDLWEINDSKQLSAAKRRQLYTQILAVALDVSVGVGERQLIDEKDIYHATEITMAQAVKQLNIKVDHLLVDAMHVPVNVAQTKLIKGDARSISIGAASIIAKVYRDELMQTYAQIYPHYGFENNAGYGTKEHLSGLATYGICPLHRHSFAPIKKYL